MDIIRHHFATLDSTNNWAKQKADEFERTKITLVTASEQTAGRGRFNRQWQSPPNQNIYATFCFFVGKERKDIGNIPQVLALSIFDLLQHLGFASRLKWPNDVLINSKKISGILCETTPFSDGICVILGVGLNVNMPLETLQKIDKPATSLHVEGGRLFDVEEILELLRKHFANDLDLFMKEGFDPFLEKYTKRLWVFEGAPLRFHDNQKVWEGDYHAINKDGSLNLRLNDSRIKMFLAGEVI